MHASDGKSDAPFLTEGDQASHHKALKLLAQDGQDLKIVSGLLQDAIVPVKDLQFLTEERRFISVLNRFCWEKLPLQKSKQPTLGERVLTIFTIDHVQAVRKKNIHLQKPDHLLNLLSVTLEQSANTEQKGLLLTFSQSAALWLHIDHLSLRLEDVGESWPTQWVPGHETS